MKHKNVEGLPVSLAMTSKKPRTSPVPPPLATTSAPPKMTIPLASAAAPPNLELPLTTPSISQPPPPLFLPSSPMNTPIPSTSQTKVEPQDDPTTFAASLSSLLDEAPGSEFEADRSGDEGDLETPQCCRDSAKPGSTRLPATKRATRLAATQLNVNPD
ncbi:hypothetical protein PISMIDRAFT_20415 [Pisolithus microcarpus 441]|uniref:Uncharacterized protein n=1 Tax=Pisolithus microcarpus 441 TaxID=765257 RepID=A0A0C9XZU1_9AGAM|nr:hypothetical protein PISMIDRAFT_20415 [Pisolithus microcarpus 441]